MEVLLDKAESYVVDLLKSKLAENILYHTLDHTRDVVNSAREIGTNSGLNTDQLDVILLAAWFHDTGYTIGADNHEANSVEIFTEFAHDVGIEEATIIAATGCIMATKMPQSPRSLIEQVICDADLLHLGKDGFFEKSSLLCEEIRKYCGKNLSDQDWMEMNKSFIEGHKYFTEYARKTYRPKKLINLASVIAKLKSYPADECRK